MQFLKDLGILKNWYYKLNFGDWAYLKMTLLSKNCRHGSFRQLLEKNWATFSSNIWSHWLLQRTANCDRRLGGQISPTSSSLHTYVRRYVNELQIDIYFSLIPSLPQGGKYFSPFPMTTTTMMTSTTQPPNMTAKIPLK